MSEFSPKHSHSELSVPDYDIVLNYGYCPSIRSEFGSTSFIECEIIGMETYHKLDIPLIYLKTRSEKEDQEEKKSDPIIKSNPNIEFDTKPIIDPSSNTIRHETNPSTSNIDIDINIYNR